MFYTPIVLVALFSACCSFTLSVHW